MTKDTMIGVDLAKSVFQLHGASMTGDPKFRKKLSRQSFGKFITEQPPAIGLAPIKWRGVVSACRPFFELGRAEVVER